VKTQVWIAVSVYVLVAILKKRLGLPHSLHNSPIPERVAFRENPDSTQAFSNIADQPEIDHTLTSCCYSSYNRTAVNQEDERHERF
jgi:hypothetical protein